jgi:hypothetical protein
MSVAIWIVVGIVGLVLGWFILKTVVALAVPTKVSGTLLLKQELRKNGIAPDNLPADFYEACIDWAQGVARVAAGPSRGSPIANRAEFVRAIETLGQMAALWIKEPHSPMFKSWGASENGYRALFAKYDLKATG